MSTPTHTAVQRFLFQRSVEAAEGSQTCYVDASGGYSKGEALPIWPWPLLFWKPTYGRRDLIKAGALILAEIERLDRAASQVEQGESSGERGAA